jgi:secondary thiamine-phosphate synthase enzyme
MIKKESINIETRGRGTVDITRDIADCVRDAGITEGLCHVFVHHTSASLMLCENADPSVRRDLEAFMARLAPDGDPAYEHDAEGPDDMPAHIRSVLTQTGLSLPVTDGRPALGTWQGVYLWEHRTHPHRRRITVTVQGEGTSAAGGSRRPVAGRSRR